MIDARASALTAEHLGVAAPVEGAWLLLMERWRSDTDQTERLAEALEPRPTWSGELRRRCGFATAAAASVVRCARPVAEVLGRLRTATEIRRLAAAFEHPGASPAAATTLVAVAHTSTPSRCCSATSAKDNLHLNLVRCALDAETPNTSFTSAMRR